MIYGSLDSLTNHIIEVIDGNFSYRGASHNQIDVCIDVNVSETPWIEPPNTCVYAHVCGLGISLKSYAEWIKPEKEAKEQFITNRWMNEDMCN